ncbi:MAG: DUF4363 family protein [Clostridia bacterium]|nr:DUF4363 family protein [Clostridia bacterium]
MKKELFIVAIIVIIIISFHAISQIYVQGFFDNISKDLDNVENKILNEDIKKEELESEINNIQEKWNKKYDYFACFIEHDELEKVQTQFISIEANIKVEDFDKSVDEIEKCKFIIKHIEEKDSLKIVNIF